MLLYLGSVFLRQAPGTKHPRPLDAICLLVTLSSFRPVLEFARPFRTYKFQLSLAVGAVAGDGVVLGIGIPEPFCLQEVKCRLRCF